MSPLLIFLLDKRHIYLPIDYGNRIYGTWIYIFFSFAFCVSIFSAHFLTQFSTITTLVDDKRSCHDRYINTCLEFGLSFSCYTNENTHSPVSYRPCPAIRHMHTHFEQRSLLKGNYSLIGKQHLWFSEKMIHPRGAVDYDNELLLRLHKAMRIESPFPKRLKTSLDVDNGQRVKTTTRRRGGRKKKKGKSTNLRSPIGYAYSQWEKVWHVAWIEAWRAKESVKWSLLCSNGSITYPGSIVRTDELNEDLECTFRCVPTWTDHKLES